MEEQGTKERGARRSDGAKLRRTVLGTRRLRLKIGPVVTGMVMGSQQRWHYIRSYLLYIEMLVSHWAANVLNRDHTAICSARFDP